MSLQKDYNCCELSVSCRSCASNYFCRSWVEFVKNHGEVKSYSHFDYRVSLAMPSIRKYVLDPSRVARHGFYPFIHFEKKSIRYGKKSRKKIRDIYYCSHLDRCVYQRYSFLINYKYNIYVKESNIDNVATAYRNNKKKNNIDLARYAFDVIQNFSSCFVMVGDFTNFFDKIDHSYLKSMLCKVLGVERLPPDYFAIFKNITRFSSCDWDDIISASGENITKHGLRKEINSKVKILTKEQFAVNKKNIKKNNQGFQIPQGSPISAMLSNVYMIEIDEHLNEYVTSHRGVYMRYSDDFIIILPCENDKISIFRDDILSFFEAAKKLVSLQPEKTSCYFYKDHAIYKDNNLAYIDYLGFLFNGKTIKLRPRSISKYYYRMRRKARTIGKRNWLSPHGKHISAKNIYTIYSTSDKERQTFVDYARIARRKLQLQDPEADALISRHKHKITMAIKNSMIH